MVRSSMIRFVIRATCLLDAPSLWFLPFLSSPLSGLAGESGDDFSLERQHEQNQRDRTGDNSRRQQTVRNVVGQSAAERRYTEGYRLGLLGIDKRQSKHKFIPAENT